MPEPVQTIFASWTAPIPFSLTIVASAMIYLRGWRQLRLSASNVIPAWRASSFLVGVFLVWLAIGSPLALLDEQLLTAHMMQHLLLMTIAPALIWIGAPVMPMLHGLPQKFVQSVLALAGGAGVRASAFSTHGLLAGRSGGVGGMAYPGSL